MLVLTTKFLNPFKYVSLQNPRSEIPLVLRAMSSSSSSFPSTKIIADYAKSARSSCKVCDKKIEKSALRLGISFKDPRGFDNTKWHHFNCFPLESNSITSLNSVSGFSSLKISDQESLKKLVSSRDQSSERSSEAGETEREERDSKIEKSNEDEAHEAELEERKLKEEKIVADYAKSGRSSCKKCQETIDKSTVRLGISFKDPRGFENTKWHHLNCFPLDSNPLSSPETILGFSSLKSSDQETLKKLVSSGNQSPCKVPFKDIIEADGCRESISKRPGTVDDVETESEGKDSKKQKMSHELLAFAIEDVMDKYMDAELPPAWKAFQTIIYLERIDDLRDSRKIAAFDFDGCLAKTSVKRVGPDAWSLMYPSIPEKLQSLYNDGHKLVIFTNESNITRWKKSRQKAVDSKIGRLEKFIKLVKVPIQVFIACGVNSGEKEDPFRKPNPGMWHIMEQQFNSGIPIDLDQSFYVGDAAGRTDDHSEADIKFAQAIGIKFHLPEEYFKS